MKETMKNDFEVLIQYDGEINTELSRGLTLAVHNLMSGIEPDLLTRKRVTHIITECLLNLTHHAEISSERKFEGKHVNIIFEEHQHCYQVKTRNFVSNKKINFLTSRLDRINGMSSEELHENYMKQLQEGQYSAKGTAGLGFLDMARKSGNKLNYHFKEVNAESSHFDFQIIIKKPKRK